MGLVVNDGPSTHTSLSQPLGPTGRGCQHMARGRGTDIQKKDKHQAKRTKPSTKWKSDKKSKSKSTKSKSKVKDEAGMEEMLNGSTRTHLMGRDKDSMAMIASLGEQERLIADMMILKSSQN
ncbi:hypothetical protein Tco_0222201 [Tanacetum coccineum]